MKIYRATPSLCMIALLVAGCGNSVPDTGSAGSETSTSQPSLAVPVSPAPSQVNKGRGAVEYDPCLKLDDTTVFRAGFDPSTRARADQIYDTYSFIGCKFAHKEQVRGVSVVMRFLTVSATNITLDEFRNREGSNVTEAKVNGRDAITYRDASAEACYVTIGVSGGTIDVAKSVNGASTAERPCERITEIAEIVESALGK
ncbi:DUF3558 family protein [Nocardia sp. R6R-6]|uniref:DUF3558 family protein n=1 Tax=Nocardia sp. R6R-6 TaxID=3459303 RepID=UPI00403D61E8